MGKSSCCCGATPSKPCLCMKQDVMSCSAKAPMCPCYKALAEKKGAEEYFEYHVYVVDDASFGDMYIVDNARDFETKEEAIKAAHEVSKDERGKGKTVYIVAEDRENDYEEVFYEINEEGDVMMAAESFNAESESHNKLHGWATTMLRDVKDLIYDLENGAVYDLDDCRERLEKIRDDTSHLNAETFEAEVYDPMMQKKIDQNECTHRYEDGNDAWVMKYADLENIGGGLSYIEAGVKCGICGQERVGSWGINEREGFQITKGEEGRMPKMYGFYGAETFDAEHRILSYVDGHAITILMTDDEATIDNAKEIIDNLVDEHGFDEYAEVGEGDKEITIYFEDVGGNTLRTLSYDVKGNKANDAIIEWFHGYDYPVGGYTANAEYHRDSKGRFAEKPILTGSVIGGLALGLMYFMGRK